MKILHVLHTSLPFLCGYTLRSQSILREQLSAGMEVGVVSSSQQPFVEGMAPEETLEGIRHWRCEPACDERFPGRREWTGMQSLRRRLESVITQWKPDLIHAHSPMLVGLPALSAARRHQLPLVYEVRDFWENAAVDRGKFTSGSLQYKFARALEGRVLRGADAVVTLCEALRGELEERVPDANRLFVVENGVDGDRFQPGPDTGRWRTKYGLGQCPLLAYAGTFQPYEGLRTLLQALPMIRRQLPEARLLIAGGPGGEAELVAEAKALGLSSEVIFTGRLPHAEVREIYATADLLVYPRILTRTTALTTPLKPLEAMAMGKPVVVSDVPAMAELVRDGQTGRMFRAGDAADLAQRCGTLLANPLEARALGAAGRKWVLAERQWRGLVGRYANIYQQALASH